MTVARIVIALTVAVAAPALGQTPEQIRGELQNAYAMEEFCGYKVNPSRVRDLAKSVGFSIEPDAADMAFYKSAVFRHILQGNSTIQSRCERAIRAFGPEGQGVRGALLVEMR